MMRGVLIDANLLCLMVVGRMGADEIAGHPRLRAFGAQDFATLTTIFKRMGDLVLCPHILAETANLLSYRQSAQQQARWRQSLADIIVMVKEDSAPSIQAIGDAAYGWLGLTDAMLLVLTAHAGLALVSDDLRLCHEAERRGVRTINYNHIREGAVDVANL